MWGHAFVLVPIRSPLARAPVRVRMETNEYGHWDSTVPKSGKLPHLEDLSDQLFVAGAFRNYRQAGRRYYFATSQASVPDHALLGLLMDLQLRKKGRTLDDYMRAMLRKPVYDMSDLRGAWVALAGEAGAEFWDGFTPTAQPLRLRKCFGRRKFVSRSATHRFSIWDSPRTNRTSRKTRR